jgi:hypothetical protein
MLSFKSFERPAQVLGMNLMDLGLVVVFLIGAVMVLGIAATVVRVPQFLYTLVLLVSISMFFILRWMAKNRPAGFLMGFLSYHLVQPRRISLGLPCTTSPPPVKHVTEQKQNAGIRHG